MNLFRMPLLCGVTLLVSYASAFAVDQSPSSMRVMFYGQSITAGSWPRMLQKSLVRQYPSIHFEFTNPSIGGYQAPTLARTAEHDLYPWYPDLLFFHVYGDMDAYESIIREVRLRTTADIVLWSSHFRAEGDPKKFDSDDDQRAEAIRAVAQKYDALYIDLRTQWRRYLNDHHMIASVLLRDTIHLKDSGNALYAKIIEEGLGAHPQRSPQSGSIQTIPLHAPAVRTSNDGTLTLRFKGNRVVAISDGTGKPGSRAAIQLDGQRPSSLPECWALTRPSKGPAGIWTPAINRISFERTPVEEEWTLTCLPASASDGRKIRFKVTGSVTGFDGEGGSQERFVSDSGRVVIEPSDWKVAWALNFKKATLPPGFEITWKAYPLCASTYVASPKDQATVLAQGCANGEHVLTLHPESNQPLGIAHFIVYEPSRINP